MTIHELRMVRKKMHMTQKALSAMLKKEKTFICKLEAGDRLFTPELQVRVKKILTRRKVTA